jgi:hypothetical protein
MDANGIAASALSQPYSVNHAKGSEACQLARRINEQLVDIVSKHPRRFGAMATLPALATTDGVLEEMAYALDTLKLDGFTTTTSIDDIYLGDTRYDPWFEEMKRCRVILLSTQSQPRHLVPSISASTCGFWSYVRHHPHAHQIETLEQVFGPGKGGARLSPTEIREGLATFYYDLTAATSPAQLFALQQMVPLSHLVMGFDNPFMPGWTFSPAIQDMQRWNGFSQTDLSSIAHQNAASLYPALGDRLPLAAAAEKLDA